MKTKLSSLKLLGLGLTLFMSFQNFSFALAVKVPTKTCTLNRINYQCATISYGAHHLQNYDLWLPNKPHISKDRPLVVFIHGGGFYTGDKADAFRSRASGALELLNLGYAVATINYRLVDEHPFIWGQTTFPPQFHDAASAIQDLRMRASHYQYNPAKVALTGVSAGGALSLWLAFHDDLQNIYSPVFRERFSTKSQCVAVRDTQTTINLGEIYSLLGPGYKLGHGIPTMFGIVPEQYMQDPIIHQEVYGYYMSDASAIQHLSPDDRNINVMLSYGLGYGSVDIHAAEFGAYFAEGRPWTVKRQWGRQSLKELGIPYVLKVSQSADQHRMNMISHINNCFKPQTAPLPLNIASWFNSQPNETHEQACARNGMRPSVDLGFGICASGESRPTKGLNAPYISYTYGTWGDGGNLTGGTQVIVKADQYQKSYDDDRRLVKAGGTFCYKPGQKQDDDPTDLVVAYLCTR